MKPDGEEEGQQHPAAPPFGAEDGTYVTIMDQFYGLQRAGGAALPAAQISAAEIVIWKLIGTQPRT